MSKRCIIKRLDQLHEVLHGGIYLRLVIVLYIYLSNRLFLIRRLLVQAQFGEPKIKRAAIFSKKVAAFLSAL